MGDFSFEVDTLNKTRRSIASWRLIQV